MSSKPATSKDAKIDFDELRKVLDKKGPQKQKFLKSRACKIFVAVWILLTCGIIALLTTTYVIAATATTTTTTSSSSSSSSSLATTITTGTTITTSSTTSATSGPTFQIITRINDPITAIWNTAAGNMSYNSIAGTGVGHYESGHGPSECVDFSDTTYINYGNVGLNVSAMTNTAGVGTGVHTTPQIGASIVQSIQFQTGNDSFNRDPLNITLEGSNATGTNLFFGSFWTLLYTGATGLAPLTTSRLTWGELQNFTNTQSFTSYRIIVTEQRGIDYCIEFAEVHLYGLV